MERRLLKGIMTPAMIGAYAFGVVLLATPGVVDWRLGWIHAKLAGVVALTVMHGFLAHWRHGFETDSNSRSANFYRAINEIPTVLMIVIVVMVVVKPF
jgi:putative membrane protein